MFLFSKGRGTVKPERTAHWSVLGLTQTFATLTTFINLYNALIKMIAASSVSCLIVNAGVLKEILKVFWKQIKDHFYSITIEYTDLLQLESVLIKLW